MFVQIIRARTSDPDGVRRQGQRWQEELQPGAEGFVGSTAGVSADGEVVTIARFADEDAARRNSDRPEQGEWWAGMEKLLDEPRFAESSDVELLHGGGSNDAGFVQVMEGTCSDPDRLRSTIADAERMLKEHRPDLIGVLTAFHDGRFTQVNYFTSEAEARENEKKDPPPEATEQMAAMGEIMSVDSYIDLTEPQLF